MSYPRSCWFSLCLAAWVLGWFGSTGFPQSWASGGELEDFIRRPAEPQIIRKQPSLLSAHPKTSEAPARVTIDVMVLYTSEAKSLFGQEAVGKKIALGIACLNEACRRSGVNARFCLIHTRETTWHTESQSGLDELNWLGSDETVASLRDELGADLVSLLVRDGLPTGGIAELPGSFSVFNGRATTFAHEIGHNLGCEHDRAHSNCGDSDNSNFGYSFVAPGTTDVYGDLMSYVGSQIEQFSNPNCYFMDAPTGLPKGHLDAQGRPDSADAVSQINQSTVYTSLSRWSRVATLAEPSLSEDGAQFQFVLRATPTGPCVVEKSDDLVTWSLLSQGTLNGEDLAFSDPVRDQPCRFYRVRLASKWVSGQIGFIRKTVQPGWAMVANPLETPNNSLGALLPDAPEGTQVYNWVEGLQQWRLSTFSFGAWDDPDLSLDPGEGMIIHNPGPEPLALQFVGEVCFAMHNRVPLRDSIRSTAVPLAGGLSTDLGCIPFGPGAQIYRMVRPSGSYAVYTFDGESWSPSEPRLELAEAFWCRNPINAILWEHVLPQ